MVILERYWQVSDEMYAAALKMSLLTIINTGFVILIVDYGSGNTFTSDWYPKSGSSICLTLILSIFINNGVNIAFAWLFAALRWFDRGFSCNANSDKKTRQLDQASYEDKNLGNLF